jgi:hypothetical protein
MKEAAQFSDKSEAEAGKKKASGRKPEAYQANRCSCYEVGQTRIPT